jgi:phytanoyl-CoA hydroxylase
MENNKFMIQQEQLEKFWEDGYLHIPDFLNFDDVNQVILDAKSVFLNQFIRRNYIENTLLSEVSNDDFDIMLFRLFDEDIETTMNCGKQIQHLISLHKLALSDRLLSLLSLIGLEFPSISTRPVLYFNHPKLAKEKFYYKVDPHQDWRSMQGSLNSVVIWVPLMNIEKPLGALEVLPFSHKVGLMADSLENGFGLVSLSDNQKNEMRSVEVKLGDILIFSSFLIHQSGENILPTPRWSCHFRYNDLKETTFIERGYPHAYIYRPIEKLLTPNFPSQKQLLNIFKNGYTK